jgi:hypothetical protein
VLFTIRHSVDIESPELNFDALVFATELREQLGAPLDVMFGAGPERISLLWREEAEFDLCRCECQGDCCPALEEAA